ncbi:endonuclease/exonuclease/phosphatase family protein [Sphingomonas sp. BT-65]|uniref:endonuclease/exonuclease/phosphatase family protein n=1 Tax=Sphingomonas sp. BT-65 TaxID=2989821 RepID=UPI0022359D26|nr:endonuclease/exonuclease/phosphatase family protein [Sphingomonas sp. BT-65]MCW4461914.1 endonuclease/exonuclease/phosphatase family protein [Sphingomonas sp. BT-65]
MTLVRIAGRLLSAAGVLAIWLAALGAFVPPLDALASFLPVSLTVMVAGLAAAGLWRHGWWIAVALLTLIPAFHAIGYEAMRPIPAAAGGGDRIRVLTHNLYKGNRDLPTTAKAIANADADIVLLQEVTPGTRALMTGPGGPYPHATPCPGDRCGLLILSRWPILASGYFLEDARGRRMGPPLLWARIAAPGGALVAATTHYPWPLPAAAQAAKRRSLAQALARTDRDALILGGDMNLTPWSAAMREQDAAFAPLTRMTRAAFSWPAQLPLLPIDQLYAGPDWAKAGVRRLPATGSDHRPILVTLVRR